MSLRFQNLSEQELERHCTEEQQNFRAKLPNDPQYCFELVLRVTELPTRVGVNIILRVLYDDVVRTVGKHSMLGAIGEEPTTIASQVLLEFYFKKIMQPEFRDNSHSFAGIMELLRKYVHTYIVGEYRKISRINTFDSEDGWTTLRDPSIEPEVALESDLFAQTFVRCINDLYPTKPNIKLLAYLSFILGLPPKEIDERYPDMWKSTKQLVARIRKRLREQSFIDCMGL